MRVEIINHNTNRARCCENILLASYELSLNYKEIQESIFKSGSFLYRNFEVKPFIFNYDKR